MFTSWTELTLLALMWLGFSAQLSFWVYFYSKLGTWGLLLPGGRNNSGESDECCACTFIFFAAWLHSQYCSQQLQNQEHDAPRSWTPAAPFVGCDKRSITLPLFHFQIPRMRQTPVSEPRATRQFNLIKLRLPVATQTLKNLHQHQPRCLGSAQRFPPVISREITRLPPRTLVFCALC